MCGTRSIGVNGDQRVRRKPKAEAVAECKFTESEIKGRCVSHSMGRDDQGVREEVGQFGLAEGVCGV